MVSVLYSNANVYSLSLFVCIFLFLLFLGCCLSRHSEENAKCASSGYACVRVHFNRKVNRRFLIWPRQYRKESSSALVGSAATDSAVVSAVHARCSSLALLSRHHRSMGRQKFGCLHILYIAEPKISHATCMQHAFHKHTGNKARSGQNQKKETE